TGVQVDLVFVRKGNQVVQLLECDRVVIPRARLKPRPHHVKAHDRVAKFVHLGEVRLNVLGIPLHRPLHRGLRRHPVRPHGNKALAIMREIRSVKMHRGELVSLLRFGILSDCNRASEEQYPRKQNLSQPTITVMIHRTSWSEYLQWILSEPEERSDLQLSR